jgi:hypothetical protein
MDVEELNGMDGVVAPVISNPLLGAVTQPLAYTGDWTTSAAGRNGFITVFEYRS